MKFRGVMIDTVPMREFNNIVTTLSKLCKECVLRLSNKSIYFIVSEENCGPLPPMIWCELDHSSFFSEYLMEGVDDVHKDIYLSFGTGQLARTLITLKQSAKCIKMKLTKKQCPCLTLEIELPSLNAMHTRHVTHDVPVTVIPRKVWKDYAEPAIQKYNISIEMPSLKQLKSIVDRMRNMSPELILKANAAGQMILQIKTELATVSSRFKNLPVEYFNDNDKDTEDDEEPSDFIICRIDIKMFGNFLTSNQTNCTKFLCSLVHKKMVNLFLEKEGIMSFQCFIPAIYY